MSKYNARKVEVDGIVFDSIAESLFYRLLLKMKRTGEILSFEMQPTFTLQPSFTNAAGKRIRPIKYIADFKVVYADGTIKVIDIKGFPTTDFLLKKKMFEFTQKKELIVLKYTKRGGFIEWDQYKKEQRERKKAKNKTL